MRVSQRAPRTHRNKWIFLRTVSLAEAWRGAQRHARGWRARSHFQGRVRVPFALLKGVRIARRDASAGERRRRRTAFGREKIPSTAPCVLVRPLRFERRHERRVRRFSGSVGACEDVGSRGGASRALRARNRGQDQRRRVFFARQDPRRHRGFGPELESAAGFRDLGAAASGVARASARGRRGRRARSSLLAGLGPRGAHQDDRPRPLQ